MYQNIKVTPNKNNVGAIIETNLSNFNKEIIEEIKDALAEYGVVFFRNQQLDSQAYIDFAKAFGNLAEYPMLKGLDGFPEITVVEKYGIGYNTSGTIAKIYTKLCNILNMKSKQCTKFHKKKLLLFFF